MLHILQKSKIVKTSHFKLSLSILELPESGVIPPGEAPYGPYLCPNSGHPQNLGSH